MHAHDKNYCMCNYYANNTGAIILSYSSLIGYKYMLYVYKESIKEYIHVGSHTSKFNYLT